MSCVVVVADKEHSDFICHLHRLLGAFFPTALIRPKSLHVPPQNAEIILTDSQHFARIEAATQLIICKGLCEMGRVNGSFKNAIAIVDSDDGEPLPAVSSTNLPVITCGLSKKDSITLSSIGREQVVVSVQRSIQCMNGSIAEPQEIPFRLSGPVDHFVLMALTAIVLFLGQSHRLLEGKNMQKFAQELTE